LKAYLAEWSKRPLKPSERDKWLAGMQTTLGEQDIEVFGIDPRTRVGQVIVEADYRMKLVGMGLEDGTLGVTSYLDAVAAAPERNNSMSVLRWWFTLNYGGVVADSARQAFALKGQGVKVLSENELLSERGERIHTGQSNEPTEEFAHSFTKHFPQLAAKYPIYAELANLFDLALVAALAPSEDLPGQVGWHLTHFGPDGAYGPALGHAPKTVQTVVSHRVVNQKHVLGAVSGGVSADARSLVAREAIRTDAEGAVASVREESAPKPLADDAWWWD
jgi:hypothetical protein